MIPSLRGGAKLDHLQDGEPSLWVSASGNCEGMTLLANDGTLRLPVQSDGFTTEGLDEKRSRCEVHDPRALNVSGVEVHPGSFTA